jgi:hypothetical protein
MESGSSRGRRRSGRGQGHGGGRGRPPTSGNGRPGGYGRPRWRGIDRGRQALTGWVPESALCTLLHVRLGRRSQSCTDGRASAGRASTLSRGRPGVRLWRECRKRQHCQRAVGMRGAAAGSGVAESESGDGRRAVAGSDLQVEERGDRIREKRGQAHARVFLLRTHSSVSHLKPT